MNLTINVTGSPEEAAGQLSDFAVDVMAVAKKMHWISSSFAGTIFLLIGLIGNLLSLLIWGRKMKKSATELYLVAQSIHDMGVLIFFFLTDSLIMILPKVKESYAYGVFFSYIGYPIFYFFIVTSIWTLVGVTVDRYINVCWFRQAKSLCSQRNAIIGILMISLLSFIINTPHFGSYYAIPDNIRPAGTPAYDYTEFALGKGSQMYEFWVHCMFIVLVPWVTILCLNLMIICRVTKLNKQMSESRGEEAKERALKRENQMTRLLLTVTFTFLLLIAVQCITQCFFMLQPETADLKIVNEAFAVAKLGIVINSSINFILYCVSGKWFRRELAILMMKMCGCRQLVPEANYTSDAYSVPSTVELGKGNGGKGLPALNSHKWCTSVESNPTGDFE